MFDMSAPIYVNGRHWAVSASATVSSDNAPWYGEITVGEFAAFRRG